MSPAYVVYVRDNTNIKKFNDKLSSSGKKNPFKGITKIKFSTRQALMSYLLVCLHIKLNPTSEEKPLHIVWFSYTDTSTIIVNIFIIRDIIQYISSNCMFLINGCINMQYVERVLNFSLNNKTMLYF